ncbi:DNA methylase [Leptolyngbya valderiana BDU 20041]|nr:DNA methylase [Leptolyngbya valderiana BDU 20041]
MGGETFLDGRVTMHVGDCLAELATMAPDSVDCVVTSPPYWGLRDYGVEGQIGLEPTLGEHLDVMVTVFDAVRRVLKPTGTLWLNYGDCYATAPNGRSAAETRAGGNDDRTFRDKPFSTVGPVYGAKPGQPFEAANGTSRRGGGSAPSGGVLKPKDLCMIPNRLAIALQDAGWWVRSEIVWGKPNPMPDSSGVYRPSTAHEKIFLLTKSADGDVWRARDTGEMSFEPNLAERCALVTRPDEDGPRWVRLGAYYDASAVRVLRSTMADGKQPDGGDTGPGGHGSVHRNGRQKGKRLDKQGGHSRRHAGFNDRWDRMERAAKERGVTPRHEGGINHTNLDGTPRGQGRLLRNYEPAPLAVWEIATKPFSEAHFATFPPDLAERCILAGCPHGGLVLDPFGGAGTTALVALRHGRRAALIELNADYAAMARQRIEREWRVRGDQPAAPTAIVSADDIFAMVEGGPAHE